MTTCDDVYYEKGEPSPREEIVATVESFAAIRFIMDIPVEHVTLMTGIVYYYVKIDWKSATL